jgi:hypothetical protein
MNPIRHIPVPPPGPACASFEPLLPLAGQRLLDVETYDRLTAHLAACAHCQTLMQAYERMDGALRRRFAGAIEGAPALAEEIMADIEEEEAARVAPVSAHPAPEPARGHRFSVLAAVAAVLVVALLAGTLLVGRGLMVTGTSQLRPIPTRVIPPTPTAATGNDIYLNQLVMLAPNDGWAFGSYVARACAVHREISSATPPQLSPLTPTPDPACQTHDLMLHYDGQAWTPTHVAGVATITIISSPPGRERWALGTSSTGRSILLRYANGTWINSGLPAPSLPDGHTLVVEGFTMVSSDEGWAVGWDSDGNTDSFMLLHFSQGNWVPQTIPGVPGAPAIVDLHAISMVSANDGWAVGVQGSQTCVILHYHNGQWTREDLPGTAKGAQLAGSLNAVYAVSPTEAWAVGEENPSSGPGLILHYLNGTWTPVSGLQLNILHAVTMTSPTDGWVAGDGAQILHYQNGRWTREGQTIHGFYLTSISMTSPDDGWALGSYLSEMNNTSLLFHDSGGTWTPYPVQSLVP